MEQIQTALGAVGIYAALNFFILCWLANTTGALRRKHKIAIGHGGNKHLERVMRGHANAVENIPLFLLGLAIAAIMGIPLIAIHVLGLVFTIGRGMHAHHFIQVDASFRTRIVGFAVAFLSMSILFVGLLGHGIWMMF